MEKIILIFSFVILSIGPNSMHLRLWNVILGIIPNILELKQKKKEGWSNVQQIFHFENVQWLN